jgi:2',3'-cyclic-nucleotide 2'-phosphodiesterase (5'-nucleotidase family)
MRKTITLLSFLVATVSFAEPQSLTIFHTNDIHGHFTASPTAWRKDHALVGGVIALEQHLDSLRLLYPNSLYLDAGDLMTGNPFCNIEYNDVKGGALLEMLARCHVDAECLGNHEFDLGVPHLRDYVARVPYPLLDANLREKSTGKLFLSPSKTFQIGRVRVGVIGLIMNNLESVVSKKALEPFIIDDAARTAQQQIDELDPATDLIVLLTHMGADEDSALATQVHRADVIVGGHSHTRLNHPLRVNGIVIVQAGSYGENLGVLTLTVDGDSVKSYDGVLDELTLRGKTTTPLTAFADSLDRSLQEKYGQMIGRLAERWVRSYYTGSNVGNWICDRLRERYNTDVALVNAGGIRADVNAGPVTMLDVLQVLPFVNSSVIFEATGADLLKFADAQARAQALHAHGVLEMSGLTITYAKHGDTVAITKVLVGGEKVIPDQTYKIASIDYVSVSQWNHYLSFEPRNVQPTGDLLSDVVADEIKKATGPIHAPSEARLLETP